VLPLLIPLLGWRVALFMLTVRGNTLVRIAVIADLLLAMALPGWSLGGLLFLTPLFMFPYFLLGPAVVSGVAVLLAYIMIPYRRTGSRPSRHML
jgi:hypothetical protein